MKLFSIVFFLALFFAGCKTMPTETTRHYDAKGQYIGKSVDGRFYDNGGRYVGKGIKSN